MKQRYIAIVLMLICILSLVACTPGHLGSNVIAYLRDGHLWTIDPDGANAFEVAAQDTAIVGYNWSPSHQILSFRALDEDFAKTAAAKHLSSQAITGQIGDLPSSENTIGVDGGTSIPIAFSAPNVGYSNTTWNTNSTRLLYRQSVVSTSSAGVSPLSAIWLVSQSDQPGTIARKELPRSFSLPSFSYDSTHYLVVEDSPEGIFTTTQAGAGKHVLSSGVLPGHSLPATLERILWRPQHQNQSFVYAVSNEQGQTIMEGQQVSDGQGRRDSGMSLSAPTGEYQLILRTIDGHTTQLVACACTQFAWSPNGDHLLYTTGTDYVVLDVANKSVFHVVGEDGSVPYWSPDGQFLVLEGRHALQLISIRQKQAQLLLGDTQQKDTPATTGDTQPMLPTSVDALLQPVPNSIWSPDSRQFLFLTGQYRFWQGQKLASGQGLYTVSIDDHGHPQGRPTLIDRGNDAQAGWTYQDANTSFLF